MTKEEFDKKFTELMSGMAQVAFEYVGSNEEEVDTVYVYVDMEDGCEFFNMFYRINDKMVEMHKVNDELNAEVDTSMSSMSETMDIGMEDTEKMRALFEEFQGQVPTQMKLEYHPKTGAFNNDISYDLFHSNTDDLDSSDIFKKWYDELSK
jgi:hypothetical protein